jgi:hypothetical protein
MSAFDRSLAKQEGQICAIWSYSTLEAFPIRDSVRHELSWTRKEKISSRTSYVC